jgi:hypothetical protein
MPPRIPNTLNRPAAWCATAALVAVIAGAPGPVGTYRLATVNGSRVPMVWHQVDHPEGGLLSLTWISGTAEVAREGPVTVVLTSSITGPGATGDLLADTLRGSWSRSRGGRLEIRFQDGRRAEWPGTDGFRSLTIRAVRPDLDGERRPITMVLVRECAPTASGPPRCS